MLKRAERQNMVSFISRVREVEDRYLSMLTDEEVEHIYEKAYFENQTVE